MRPRLGIFDVDHWIYHYQNYYFSPWDFRSPSLLSSFSHQIYIFKSRKVIVWRDFNEVPRKKSLNDILKTLLIRWLVITYNQFYYAVNKQNFQNNWRIQCLTLTTKCYFASVNQYLSCSICKSLCWIDTIIIIDSLIINMLLENEQNNRQSIAPSSIIIEQ